MKASSLAKWQETQRRSRARYAAKVRGRVGRVVGVDVMEENDVDTTGRVYRTRIAQRSKNEHPVAMFNAQRWFNRWVVARDGRCVTASPECFGPLEASHAFPVSTSSIYRFNPKLVHAQCQFHNQRHSSDTTALAAYIDRKFGHGFFHSCKQRSLAIKQWSIGELRGIITTYRSLFQQLKKTL